MTRTEENINDLVAQIMFVMPLIPKKLLGRPPELKDEELHTTHFHVLHLIENHGSLRMNEIAQKITIKKSNLTPLIHKLTEKNLIVREKWEKDRRVTFIKLSEEGKTFLTQKKNFLQQTVKKQLEKLDTEEQAMLRQAIINMEEVLSKIED